jgi:Glycosyl transferase family 2
MEHRTDHCSSFRQLNGRVPKPKMDISDPCDIDALTHAVGKVPRVVFSIVIGRVSTEDSRRILETLDALRAQQGSLAYEVIIADRQLDTITELLCNEYPEACVLRCAAETSLPELRTLAFERARGDYIVITEDHCVPPDNWLASIFEAFRVAPEGTVAVGGAIENGVCDTALDWATFLCEYAAYVPPIQSGPARALPGMNVAYRRSAIAELDRTVLLRGFWETTVHPLLAQMGFIFYLSNEMRILHKKKFSFRLFARQRFLYSRYYAGLRFADTQLAARWAMCALTLALPPLLLVRTLGNLMNKKRLLPQLARALPLMIAFVLIGTWGEVVGYSRGPGDALSRIE